MKIHCSICPDGLIELPDDAKVAPDVRVKCRVCFAAVPQRDATTYPYAFDHDLPRNHSACAIEPQQDDAEPTSLPEVESGSAEAGSDPNEAALPDANEIGITTNKQTGRPWLPAGFGVKKIRRVRKAVPAIANDGGLTGKRKVIANLHWNLQWRSDEIADELGMTPNAVKCVIKRLRSREAARSEQRKRQRTAIKCKALKLFRMGATVRVVAAELKISIGKAQSLRPAA